MERKWWIAALFVSFSIIVLGFLGWKMLWRPEGADRLARLEVQALEERQKTTGALAEEIARLRKDLEAGSKQITKLQAKLDDARLSLESAEQRLKIRSPAESRSAEARARSREGRPAESRRDTADIYETIRTTSVYREPSTFSSKVATIPSGTRVRVVESSGEWLEVRSRHGKPPGFIRLENTRLVRNGAGDEFLAQASPSVR